MPTLSQEDAMHLELEFPAESEPMLSEDGEVFPPPRPHAGGGGRPLKVFSVLSVVCMVAVGVRCTQRRTPGDAIEEHPQELFWAAKYKFAGRTCKVISGVKLDMQDRVSADLWPKCVQKWAYDCRSSGCCTDPDMKCYEKNEEWGACKASCDSLDDKNESWTCKVAPGPVAQRTSESCTKACAEDPDCTQAVFDSSDGGLCQISTEMHATVVWAGDNFNTTVCGDADELEAIADTVALQLPFEQEFREPQQCSWAGENCAETLCCNEVGCDKKFLSCVAYSCYKKDEYFSGCQLSPPTKDTWDGTWQGGGRTMKSLAPAGSQAAAHGTSLYCFSVVNWKAPAPKPFWSTEAQLADNIKMHGVSICQCDGHDFYDGVPTPKAEWGSFSNIDAFQQIWKEVQEKGAYKNFDWTVKVDADAVFLPNRLKQHLDKLRTPKGARVYLENIDYQFKFMGALEVMTREAVDRYLEKGHECIRGKHEGGEDFFLKGCLDAIGIDHMSDYSLLADKYAGQDRPCTDGWAVAYHFHKKVLSWNWCYNEAVCGNRDKTCEWGIEVAYVMPFKEGMR
eukprot:CAMPEP_0206422944 /NCGR_PEP_ID=MMETSP0324_2-20121206/2393_1 /ASSEMBLY_ACC=CAM_ASM_000836 /TAXON_ID=2866 /ORGANISM="Crypthecodinium cohnii, Strain Seligo" /LENGTH=564 /DNA_ID=CAMNT_0053887423 /DNA_START=15 /DNA_END=1709 /DNA_ORIENTATION=+